MLPAHQLDRQSLFRVRQAFRAKHRQPELLDRYLAVGGILNEVGNEPPRTRVPLRIASVVSLCITPTGERPRRLHLGLSRGCFAAVTSRHYYWSMRLEDLQSFFTRGKRDFLFSFIPGFRFTPYHTARFFG
jgi:hypothetical protein